jgi:hypothetical protein
LKNGYQREFSRTFETISKRAQKGKRSVSFSSIVMQTSGLSFKKFPLLSFELLPWVSDVDRMSLVTPVLALQAESSLGSVVVSVLSLTR